MKNQRKSSPGIMRKYYQLILIVICLISVVTLLIYRHEYYRLRYVLEVLNFFGKPGLSEIEFCGPGFNATMLSEILKNSSMEIRETPPLFQQIDENFYAYTSFLKSYQKYNKLTPSDVHNIDTIVIGKAQSEPSFRCNIWFDNNNKPKAGKFSYRAITEPVGEFRVYVFQCSLNKNLGKPKGVSFYVNDYNINPIHAPINRLIAVNTKRKVRESSSVKFVNNIVPAICVIPNQVPMVTRDNFIEFLVFHHMMGFDYFTIYDSMISEDIIRRLNLIPSDITQWKIQFFPLNFPFVFAKSYEVVRSAIELDCLFRHFRLDKEDLGKVSHVVTLSWDEFLVPRVYSNVKAIIDDLDPTRKVHSFEVKPLLFCLNQNDDDNTNIAYPDIMKKTHYYIIPNQQIKSLHMRNLDAMKTFDDILNLNSSRIIPLETLGAHKYTECRDPKTYQPESYNEEQMQGFKHRIEGAMLSFAESLNSNKMYRLYRAGQIWEKTPSDEKDL